MSPILNFMKRFQHLNISLIDQGIVSGVNFLTGIILARALGLDGFGQFSLIWIAVLFIHSLQSALIIFPMMSIGPKIETTETSHYYGAVFVQQLVFSVITTVIVAACAYASVWFAPQWGIAGLVLPLTAVCFCFQSQEFIRRYFFVTQKSTHAIINDTISYLGQLIVLLFFVFGLKHLSVANGLWIVAVTSVIAVLAGLFSTGTLSFTKKMLQQVALRHWSFGSWSTLSNLVQWVGSQGILILAGTHLGAAALGGIKAVFNLLAPVNILMLGLYNVVPVQASRILMERREAMMVRYLRKSTMWITLALGAICLIMILLAEPMMRLLYGVEYLPYTKFIIWLVAYIVMGGLVFSLSIYFRSTERTKTYTLCTALSAPIAIGVTLMYLAELKEQAIFLGLVINQLVILLFSAVVYLVIAKNNAVSSEDARI